MKCVYFLSFVAAVQGFVEEPRQKRSQELPAPNLLSLKITANDSLEIMWDRVDSPDSRDPVLGYIVKVWQFQEMAFYIEVFKDGKLVTERVREPSFEPLDPDVVPSDTPTKIIVANPNTTNAVHSPFDKGSLYHIRVQAYTTNLIGPLSNAYNLRKE